MVIKQDSGNKNDPKVHIKIEDLIKKQIKHPTINGWPKPIKLHRLNREHNRKLIDRKRHLILYISKHFLK